MKGVEHIVAVIRSRTQSTWGVKLCIAWDTDAPDGVVSASVSRSIALTVTTPIADWWRVLDQNRKTAYEVLSASRVKDGSVLMNLRHTPIFASENERLVKGSPRG